MSIVELHSPSTAMLRLRLLAATVCTALACSAVAQVQTVERTAKGQSGKEIRVGIYVNIRPDCTSGPLPTIRLVDPPEQGTVVIKKANVNATNYKQCLALEVPGYVALYKSRPEFTGVDVLSLEITYPGGKHETQRISVTVSSASQGT
jgi:uncharacterized membrane protein